MGELSGRVAIVTGAASGIGRAAARALAAHGAAIAVVDLDAAGVSAEVAQLRGDAAGAGGAPGAGAGGATAAGRAAGAAAHGIVADLAEVTVAAAVVDDAVAALGRVDILVNAAGTSSGAGLLDTTAEVWDRIQAVNLRAPFLLMQHAARHMLAQGDGGRIVNVSSGSAFRAMPATPAYGASKAGLLSLTRMGAGELGPAGINVNAVAPGITTTPMALRALGDQAGDLDRLVSEGPMANLLHRVSTPEDVAAVIVFLCLPASRQITGQTINTSAGSIV